MKTSTAVAGGVGALVVVGVGVLALGIGFTPDSSFSLQKDGTGACKPSDPSAMSGGWSTQVTWRVTNVDCDPQYLSLRNFKHPLGNGTFEPPVPVLKDDPLNDGPVTIGKPITLKSKVDKFVWWKTNFKYEIWNGPAANALTMGKDPDIDVWP